jgi:predicted transcriptional regulator
MAFHVNRQICRGTTLASLVRQSHRQRPIAAAVYDLADRLGVDQSFISKYESARRRLDVIEFLRIMKAIGVDHRVVLDALK